MKPLIENKKYAVSIFVTILIVFGAFSTGYVQAQNVGEPRTVRLFYFLPNDRPYQAHVVEAMKTGILSVQSFYADQMEAHGHGRKTFQIETDTQGTPIVHRVNGDYASSHYESRDRPGNEINRAFDTSSIVQLIVMDMGRSNVAGHGVGIKQRGRAVIIGGWNWGSAAHELGHAFGLQHDFRDDAYIMSYGSNSNSLSACAAHFLSVNPYFNQTVPFAAGNLPSVEISRSPSYGSAINLPEVGYHGVKYSYGQESLQLRFRVRDSDGLQQVLLFAKTPEGAGFGRPSGFHEVVACHNLSGQTDTTVTFNFDGDIPSVAGDVSVLNRIKHRVYVSAVDRQGNRIDHPIEFTLHAAGIQQAKHPVGNRSSRVRDSIYNVVRLFHDRNVSAYRHITDAHLADITNMNILKIRASDSALQSNDFDGLTGLSTLELRFKSGYSDNTLLPAGIFKGLTSLNNLKVKWYADTYGSDTSLLPFLPLTVGLKKVGEGQFKAVVPTGAPFDMDVPLIVVNGSINGGAESVMIPAGSVESDILTVTRTPGTTAAVIVDLERTVSSPPESGYVFYKSSFHLEVFSPLAGAPTPVSEHTPQVLDAIVGVVPEINYVLHGRERRYMVNGTFIRRDI